MEITVSEMQKQIDTLQLKLEGERQRRDMVINKIKACIRLLQKDPYTTEIDLLYIE